MNIPITIPKDMWPAEWRLQNKKDIGCAVDRQNYYCLWHKDPNCCWLNGFFSDVKGSDALSIKKREHINMQYFERMSKAYALTCTGKVCPLSELTGDLLWKDPPVPAARSIWWSHELPVLRAKWERDPNSVQLILVGYNKDKPTGTQTDITSEVLGRHPGGVFAYEDTLDYTRSELTTINRLIGDLPHNMTDAGGVYFSDEIKNPFVNSSSEMRLLAGHDGFDDGTMSQRKTCTKNSNIEPKGEDWFG